MAYVVYRASDRRVYNGCPCSDIAREWAHTDALEKRMKAVDPTARCTYFPAEAEYLVFLGFHPLTNNFHANKQEALIEAILILEDMQKRLGDNYVRST